MNYHLKYKKKRDEISKTFTNRDHLSSRELTTFKFLIKEFYNHHDFKNKKVLEIGCGDRILQKFFEEQGMEYFGVDIEECNLETDNLNFNENSFDFIISLAVIEHIQNPHNFFKNAMRCLKGNGLIYLTTPNFTYCYENFYDDYTHVKPYTAESLRYILDAYDFDNIKILPGLRCKPKWYYVGRFRFWIAAKLIPFTNNFNFLPNILKGKATSLIGIARKKTVR